MTADYPRACSGCGDEHDAPWDDDCETLLATWPKEMTDAELDEMAVWAENEALRDRQRALATMHRTTHVAVNEGGEVRAIVSDGRSVWVELT